MSPEPQGELTGPWKKHRLTVLCLENDYRSFILLRITLLDFTAADRWIAIEKLLLEFPVYPDIMNECRSLCQTRRDGVKYRKVIEIAFPDKVRKIKDKVVFEYNNLLWLGIFATSWLCCHVCKTILLRFQGRGLVWIFY